MRHLLNWALSALAVWIVARLVPGFHVSGPLAALIAALVIGFVNATLGVFLKIVTFPLVLLTLGLFWLVINAAMIELASAVVPGFHVDTFGAAFIGAIVLALVNMFFRWLAGTGEAGDKTFRSAGLQRTARGLARREGEDACPYAFKKPPV